MHLFARLTICLSIWKYLNITNILGFNLKSNLKFYKQVVKTDRCNLYAFILFVPIVLLNKIKNVIYIYICWTAGGQQEVPSVSSRHDSHALKEVPAQ